MKKELINYLEQSKDLYGVYPDLGLSVDEIKEFLSNTDPAAKFEKNQTATSTNQSKLQEQDIPYRTEYNSDFKDLNSLHIAIKDCQNCKLGSTRTKFVFGKGNPNANIMLIGEAPGHDEDMQGVPFVGKAGQLLDKILAAIQLSLNDVYIANILKCRPPNNRDPQPDEIEQCIGYLKKQIDFIQPKMILALGRVAGKTLLGKEISLSKMRNQIHRFHNIDMMVTYHPSALLRNPQWKKPTWEDVQNFMKHFKKNY